MHVSSRKNTFPRRDLERQITVAIVASPLIPHASNELLPLVVASETATKAGTREAFLPGGNFRKPNDLPFTLADRADRTCGNQPTQASSLFRKRRRTGSASRVSPLKRRDRERRARMVALDNKTRRDEDINARAKTPLISPCRNENHSYKSFPRTLTL